MSLQYVLQTVVRARGKSPNSVVPILFPTLASMLKMAMGVPLIGAIFEKDPRVALYTLPLLVWYPLQLIVGSFLAPYLKQYVIREKWRLLIEGGRPKDWEAPGTINAVCSTDCESSAGSLSFDSDIDEDHSVCKVVEADIGGTDHSDPETAATESTSDDQEEINENDFHESFHDDFLVFSPLAARKKKRKFRRQDTDTGADKPLPPIHSNSFAVASGDDDEIEPTTIDSIPAPPF